LLSSVHTISVIILRYVRLDAKKGIIKQLDSQLLTLAMSEALEWT